MGNLISSARRSSTSKSNHPEAVVFSQQDISDTLQREGYNDRDHGRITWKTLFSSDRTSTSALTAGIATCPPRREGQPRTFGGHLAPHRHAHPEIYYVIRGTGIVNVEMIEHRVEAGSAVFIPGNAEHSVRNESLTEDLVFHYCFAADSFKDVKYRFTNDAGAMGRMMMATGSQFEKAFCFNWGESAGAVGLRSFLYSHASKAMERELVRFG
ncbi:hypothetical protein D0859_01686 [Hortaea werneckii]|uniref:Cupin type-2 domain-containing protein n=1 Tax=Hortaea werneckii TaxID=91943 RepID=A0A3M7J8X9_HORWE|nr:hypothetical protein D0859_01686 [Hortaea werneckii]